MNTLLKHLIEKEIQNIFNANCEEGLWEGYIHTELVQQMTNAAEQVFDATMKSQIFVKEME